MHNAAIAALGLHFVYIPFSVRPEDLGGALQSLPRLGIVGVNLTIPHKESAIPFMDEITPEARAIGAVNTVSVRDRKLIGSNTDGEGFMAPLLKRGFRAKESNAVVLGAGGAARSVVYRLAAEGASLVVANRDPARAERLAAEFRSLLPGSHISAAALGSLTAAELSSADLVVNATSAGMQPNDFETPPIPLKALRKGQIVYDLVYRPVETRLLAAAKEAGAETLNGVGMLVHQGAEALKQWTGVEPPIVVMERAVLNGLDGNG